MIYLRSCGKTDCNTILGCKFRDIEISCGENSTCRLMRIFDACPITNGKKRVMKETYRICKNCSSFHRNR